VFTLSGNLGIITISVYVVGDMTFVEVSVGPISPSLMRNHPRFFILDFLDPDWILCGNHYIIDILTLLWCAARMAETLPSPSDLLLPRGLYPVGAERKSGSTTRNKRHFPPSHCSFRARTETSVVCVGPFRVPQSIVSCNARATHFSLADQVV